MLGVIAWWIGGLVLGMLVMSVRMSMRGRAMTKATRNPLAQRGIPPHTHDDEPGAPAHGAH